MLAMNSTAATAVAAATTVASAVTAATTAASAVTTATTAATEVTLAATAVTAAATAMTAAATAVRAASTAVTTATTAINTITTNFSSNQYHRYTSSVPNTTRNFTTRNFTTSFLVNFTANIIANLTANVTSGILANITTPCITTNVTTVNTTTGNSSSYTTCVYNSSVNPSRIFANSTFSTTRIDDELDGILGGELIRSALINLPLMWKHAFGGLFICMFVLAGVQNAIVFVTLSQFAVLDTHSYKIQKCLVLTDFISGITCGPLNAIQLLLESTLRLNFDYKMVYFHEIILWLQMVLVLVIINITLFISYNRYRYQTISDYQLSASTVTRLLFICWLVPLLTIALQLLGDAVKVIMWIATIEFSLNVIFIIHYTKETNKSLDNMTEIKLNKTETYQITRTIVVIITLTVVLKSPVIINILIILTTEGLHVEFYVIGNFICILSSVLNPLIFGSMLPIRTHIKKLLSHPRLVHPEAGQEREVVQNKYLETCEYLDANPSPPPQPEDEFRSVITNVLAYPVSAPKKRSISNPASRGAQTPGSEQASAGAETNV